MDSPRKKSARAKKSGTSQANERGKAWLVVAAIAALAAGTMWWTRHGSNSARLSHSSPQFGTAELEDERKVFAAYAGSESCRECHKEAFEAWAQSHHGLAERPLKPRLDAAAFDPPRSFPDGAQFSRVLSSNGACEVVTVGLSRQPETHVADRVIGVDPLRQFLVAAPGGRFQTLEVSYDPRSNQWFNVYGNENRQPGEWGHWTGRGMNWNNMCAVCHNTRLRKNYTEASDSYATRMVEMGVGCEACHGPMKNHVEWQKKFSSARNVARKSDPTLDRLTRDQILDTCGACHARRRELTGDFKPGDAFLDHYSLVVPDDTDLYYPDGQVREEDYEFAAFLGSRMHAGGVRCLDCHQPHSAKTILPGNLLCMRCHSGAYTNSPKIDPATHTFHRTDSAGSQCVNCHMPQTTYMQRHVRHDHGFTIPDPLLTRQHGVPNACNRCHSDRDADWSLAAVEKWYGPRMERSTRQRSQWIAAARHGDDSARDRLVEMLQASETPYWKGVAAGLLNRWATEPKVASALLAALGHSNALVRAQAAHSLEPLVAQSSPDVPNALRKLLDDPMRNVRVAAAWALRSTLDPQSRAAREMLLALDTSADQPTGQLQLGAYDVARNQSEKAVAHYEKAVAWDTNSAPSRHDLAVALSLVGRSQEAVKQLEEACRLDPHEGEYQYKLALAWNETGELDKAAAALEEAVRLNPRHSRAWYNLGLARNAQGQADAAIEVLLRGEAVGPKDPQLPFARATILLRLGRLNEARAAARRALEIQPQFQPARELLGSMR